MKFDGEHLLIGQLGHFLVIFFLGCFVIGHHCILSIGPRPIGTRKGGLDEHGKGCFLAMGLGIVGIFSAIFISVFNIITNTCMLISMRPGNWNSGTCLPVYGRARKAVSCYGPSGIWYSACYSCTETNPVNHQPGAPGNDRDQPCPVLSAHDDPGHLCW